MENTTEPTGHDRMPRVAFGPDARLIAATGVLALAAAVAAALSGDAGGRLLLAGAALVLAAYTGTDLICRPRLVADPAGLRVRSPGAFLRLPWAHVEAVRADVRSRHGLRTVTLEIDTGDRLVVLTRRGLGADPERVAELVNAFVPSAR